MEYPLALDNLDHSEDPRHIRTGIAFAYSNQFNARGLEALWYGPYMTALNEVVAAQRDDFFVYPQYPLWIPGTDAEEIELRRKFEEYGLLYDADDCDQPNMVIDVEPQAALGIHKSSRIAEKERKKARDNAQALIKEKRDLLACRADLESRCAKARANDPYDEADLSQGSIGSTGGKGAIDELPDFAILHLKGLTLDMPAPPLDSTPATIQRFAEAMNHYLHRAGIKISHACLPLIAELKPAIPRVAASTTTVVELASDLAGDTAIDNSTRTLLRQAARDLIEYCSAYFLVNSKATAVIALAGIGPVWGWAKVTPQDVPKFDWKYKIALDTQKEEDLRSKIENHGLFTLCTAESDRELQAIARDHIFTLLQDGHDH